MYALEIRIVRLINAIEVDANTVDIRNVSALEWLKRVCTSRSSASTHSPLPISVVRYGSLQGRRGRLPSKAKYQQSDEPPSPPLPLVTSLARAYHESCTTTTDPSTNSIDTISTQQLIGLLESSYMATLRFALKIPGVQDMPRDDIHTLLNLNFFSMMALRIAYRYVCVSSLFILLFQFDE